MRLLFYLQLWEMKHLNPIECKLMDNTWFHQAHISPFLPHQNNNLKMLAYPVQACHKSIMNIVASGNYYDFETCVIYNIS